MAKIKNLRYLIFFLLNATFLCTQSSNAITIDKIVAFGDSYSDNGNLFALTTKGNAVTSLMPIVPKDPPYYAGRFSNGFVWIEELAKNLHVPLLDYAYGGSWAESIYDSHVIIPFGLSTQVNFYLVSTAPDFTIGQHLFVIWAGANDYPVTRLNPEYATTNTVAAIRSQIDWLKLYGAKNFLVLNLPNLGNTPFHFLQGPNAVMSLNNASQLHNRKMAAMIAREKQDNPGLRFIFIDVIKIYGDIIAYPERYHLKNVLDACYRSDPRAARMNSEAIQVSKNANFIMQSSSLQIAYLTSLNVRSGERVCENPDDYFFWDGVHTTKVVHKLLSIHIQQELKLNGFEQAY